MARSSRLEDQFYDNWVAMFPNLPRPQRQFRAVPGWLDHLHWRRLRKPRSRAWVADFAWPEARVIVEIQGGTWMKGVAGHSSGAGIRRDCEKAMAAQVSGWVFLPITRDMLLQTPCNHFVRMVAHLVRERTPQPQEAHG